mgnify:CR=1 FL=1
MAKVKKSIGYKQERVVLSDILPYEVPPFFSNRFFYSFLVENKIVFIEKPFTKKVEIRFKKGLPDMTVKVLMILFGVQAGKLIETSNTKYDLLKISENELKTQPFKFRIAHKNSYRELTVIHPLNQLRFVWFYNQFKNDILFFCNKSRFSLRKPDKVASLKYFKDSTFQKRKATDSEMEIIETSDREYKGLKTYFTYSTYSNIYKFYESKQFHLAEKRFKKLVKFDISRCFDSIYTHTLPWALSNKKIVKDNLDKFSLGFGNVFDHVMQRLNYNETNGIVIGPEFSRIFAELILQEIDLNVERELLNLSEKSGGLVYKRDYDAFRYLDDYFLFFNDDNVKDRILAIYQLKLQEYNLFLNDQKTTVYEQPIITDISRAKEQVRTLIETSSIFDLPSVESKETIGVFLRNSSDVITNYKKVLVDTKTSYKDLQNYFLATIFNKTKKLIKTYLKVQKSVISNTIKIRDLELDLRVQGLSAEKENELTEEKQTLSDSNKELLALMKKYDSSIVGKLIEIVELSFFVYSVLPKVSYSIKLCHILFRIIDFIKNQESTRMRFQNDPSKSFILNTLNIGFSFDRKHIVFKHIYEGISVVLEKSKQADYSEIETLYLLAVLGELGSEYELPEETIITHFQISLEDDPSYFLIVSLLHHIKRNSNYNTLREKLRGKIEKRFEEFERSSAQDVLLFIDILNCPYLANSDDEVLDFRVKVLGLIKFFDNGVSKLNQKAMLRSLKSNGVATFSAWEDSDLGRELNTKRGHEVY